MTDVCVGALDFSEHLDRHSRREAVLVYELWQGERRLSMGVVAFVPTEFLELPAARVSSEVVEQDGTIRINLATDNLARYVMLHVPDHDVRFEDNYFDLPAGRSVTVTVEKLDGLSASDLAGMLRVVSLRDTY